LSRKQRWNGWRRAAASTFGLSAAVQKEFSWFERSQSRVEPMNEVVVDMVAEDMVLFLDSTLKATNTLI
jgi:hypothetical protein